MHVLILSCRIHLGFSSALWLLPVIIREQSYQYLLLRKVIQIQRRLVDVSASRYPLLFHQAFLCHLQVHSQQLRSGVFCRPWIQYHWTVGKLNCFRKSTCHIRQIPLFSFKPKMSNTKGQLNPSKTNTIMTCVGIQCPARIPQILAAKLRCEWWRKTEQWPLGCCDTVPVASLKGTMS